MIFAQKLNLQKHMETKWTCSKDPPKKKTHTHPSEKTKHMHSPQLHKFERRINSITPLFASLGTSTSVSDCFKACRTGEAVFNSSFPVVLYFYTPTTSSTRNSKKWPSSYILGSLHSFKGSFGIKHFTSAVFFSPKKSSSQKQVHPSTSPNPFFGEVKEAGKRDLKESRTKTRVVHTPQLYIRS